MRKIILSAAVLCLTSLAAVGARAQETAKKDDEKSKTTTVDAWRDALPAGEQAPSVMPPLDSDKPKTKGESEETTAQIEKRILGLEQRLMEAVKTRDAAALNRLLADDFVTAGINLTGAQPEKARYIEWALKNLELKSYILEKPTVRAYPSAAVVTFNYKRQATVAGAPADGDFTVTDVWVKTGNRWQAVSHHISQTPKP